MSGCSSNTCVCERLHAAAAVHRSPRGGPASVARSPDLWEPGDERADKGLREAALEATARAHVDAVPVAELQRDLWSLRAPVGEAVGDQDAVGLRVVLKVQRIQAAVREAVVRVLLAPP